MQVLNETHQVFAILFTVTGQNFRVSISKNNVENIFVFTDNLRQGFNNCLDSFITA